MAAFVPADLRSVLPGEKSIDIFEWVVGLDETLDLTLEIKLPDRLAELEWCVMP